MKETMKRFLPSICAAFGLAIGTGITASLLGETVGYHALFVYFYATLGYPMVKDFIEKKLK